MPGGEAAGRADEQAEGHVRRRIGKHARGVADSNAAGRGGCNVNVVETHSVVADHLQTGSRV